MKRMQTKVFAVLLAVCALVPANLRGQTFGEITGEIRDATGAVIAGATVTVTNLNTNATRTAVSNEAGVYSFPLLVPGSYSAKVEKVGFKSATRSQFDVQVQQSARIDFVLEVGSVSESIEVSASAGVLATENATVGTVIENKRIVELPLNGRNYLQLVSLAPNVSFGFPSAGQAGSRQGGQRAAQNIAVAGQRNNFNRFTLDGVENTDPNFNTFVIQPSIDAIQEFKVQSGIYPAEFGRASTQINVSTKSGGNAFHGSLFHFVRNDKFDAKNYAFTSARPPKDPFKWNQFGFTLSGPVTIPKLFDGRNRLFFMSNYEWFRQRRSIQAVYNLPSSEMRQGNFNNPTVNGIYDPKSRVLQGDQIVAQRFPNDIIPQSRFHPIAVKLLEFYPEPNLPNPQLRQNRVQANGRPINRDQFVQRIDFVESSNSNWFGRYSYGDENELTEELRLNGTKVITSVDQWMVSNTRVLSPSVVNETRFGYTSFYNTIGTQLAFQRDVLSELNIPGLKAGPPVTWGTPSVNFSGIYSGFGDSSEGPYENNNKALQIINNTAIIRGKHSVRFGGEIRWDQYNQVGNQFARGNLEFQRSATINPAAAGVTGDPFADFLLGEIFQAEAAVSIAEARFRATSFALYIDDTWKVTPRFTINAGLRYENTPPWEDQTGKLFSVYIPFFDSTPSVADRSRYPKFIRQGRGDPYEGVNIRWPDIEVIRDGRLGNRLVARDNNDFAPRLGLTWNFAEGWVIRTGAGLFYSQDTGNPRFDMARNLAGRTRFVSNNQFPDVNFDTAFLSLEGAIAQVPTPYAFANLYERRTPRTMQYMFDLQRELPMDMLLEVGYLGNFSRHLESLRAVNEAIPAPLSDPRTVAERSPYPNFGRIQLVDNGGNANYNSLGVKLTKRYSHGATFMISYTWAKSIDYASAIRNQGGDTLFPQNSYCMRCERGLSSFDTRHRFVTSALWDLPIGRGRKVHIGNRFLDAVAGGWQLGSIITLQSGFPITVNVGGDYANNQATGFIRPNATGENPNLPRGKQDPQMFFNLNAFALQPRGQLGNAGRNVLTGPGIIGWDFSTLKNFQVSEGKMFQFRFEAFNFPNHPNWGNPDTNMLSNNRGRINGTRGNMRNLQLGLKFLF
ncbi:MAG: TonB-dependent receptor [Bryobacteraceae bacterium]|nr:TonB-dependent receptor [Bryobacteraceae bacterium]